MQLLIATPTLGEAQEEYTWITYTVLGMNQDLLTVGIVELECTTVTTLMMLD